MDEANRLGRSRSYSTSMIPPGGHLAWHSRTVEGVGKLEDHGQIRVHGNVECVFDDPPRRVMVVRRPHSEECVAMFNQVIRTLRSLGCDAVVEPDASEDVQEDLRDAVVTWSVDVNLASLIDLVVAIGGDGTILWTSNLFPGVAPPVFTVAMGTLCYLAVFRAPEVVEVLRSVMSSPFYIQLRSRLLVSVYDEEGSLMKEMIAMNECVVDRGTGGSMIKLDVYCNNEHFTTVIADGLLVSTPTGSTAYSLSAGGPVVHPVAPCMILTPVCPHSLSFRPVIFPDHFTLRVVVAPSSVSTWICVDGRNRTQLRTGMAIGITLARHPFPLIVSMQEKPRDPWRKALNESLHWNRKATPAEASPISVSTHFSEQLVLDDDKSFVRVLSRQPRTSIGRRMGRGKGLVTLSQFEKKEKTEEEDDEDLE